jgi:hypothetical protein
MKSDNLYTLGLSLRFPSLRKLLLVSAVGSLAFFVAFFYYVKSMNTDPEVSDGVLIWWSSLSSVSLFNLVLWGYSFAIIDRMKDELTGEQFEARKKQLWLSLVYVLVCGFRSFVPRADVQTIALIDSPLSAVEIGRSVATIAELCFAAQWALILREYAREHGARLAVAISFLILPIISLAECFSWYAVLTTNFIGNTLEQSLWTFSAFLFIVAIAGMWREISPRFRPLFLVAGIFSLSFIAFMASVDVPMYFNRWLADEASGKQYRSVLDALGSMTLRWRVTHRWVEWKEELAWMAFYFSTAVWSSIALIHSPRIKRASVQNVSSVG